jgi:4'-phosphopantetheinyl transferase
MPLLKMQTNDQGGWGLWFISEPEDELKKFVLDSPEETIQHPHKKLEWLAARALLLSLTKELGIAYQGINKNEAGKPHLIGSTHPISLSHSFPYVAAQLDFSHPVGIDLEKPRPQLLKIAHRVLSASEHTDAGESIVKHCVYWCAKEAMYKKYGKRGLHFSTQLLVRPFVLQSRGNLQGKIVAGDGDHPVEMTYHIQPDYVMVLTTTSNNVSHGNSN